MSQGSALRNVQPFLGPLPQRRPFCPLNRTCYQRWCEWWCLRVASAYPLPASSCARLWSCPCLWYRRSRWHHGHPCSSLRWSSWSALSRQCPRFIVCRPCFCFRWSEFWNQHQSWACSSLGICPPKEGSNTARLLAYHSQVPLGSKCSKARLLTANLRSRQDFPTPEFPMIKTLKW